MFGFLEVGMQFDGKFDLWTHPRSLLDHTICTDLQA